ncbi:MAG: cupin domain-containing protein [Pseudomonadota bacterium]
MKDRQPLKSPALDPAMVAPDTGTSYPAPFRALVAGRARRRLGNALGLKNFGVNLTKLPPGCASSQRHWHTRQDEFVYVLEGEVVLVTDAGEQVLTAGMAAGFPAGKPDGHHLVNRSGRDALVLEVGDRTPGDEGNYPDIDMMWRIVDGEERYLHKDGTPY